MILAGFVLAVVSAGRRQPQPFDYSSQLGLVDFSPQGQPCLTIENSSLPVDAVLHIVSRSPQTLSVARVLARLEASCSRNPETGPRDSFYSLQVSEKEFAPGDLGIAVVGFEGKFPKEGGLLRPDLNGNGQPDSFRICTSSEGLHVTVWDGPPLKGSRKWHRYYYLGYDVEPNCKDRDFRP